MPDNYKQYAKVHFLKRSARIETLQYSLYKTYTAFKTGL